MNGEKDYGKINDELLGILIGTNGENAMRCSMGKHQQSKDYYVTQAVAGELARQAPEILNKTKQVYRLVADNPNQLIGKLAKFLINNVEFTETPNGSWEVDVPIWQSKNDESI